MVKCYLCKGPIKITRDKHYYDEKLKKRYHLKCFAGICPTCGKPVSKKKKHFKQGRLVFHAGCQPKGARKNEQEGDGFCGDCGVKLTPKNKWSDWTCAKCARELGLSEKGGSSARMFKCPVHGVVPETEVFGDEFGPKFHYCDEQVEETDRPDKPRKKNPSGDPVNEAFRQHLIALDKKRNPCGKRKNPKALIAYYKDAPSHFEKYSGSFDKYVDRVAKNLDDEGEAYIYHIGRPTHVKHGGKRTNPRNGVIGIIDKKSWDKMEKARKKAKVPKSGWRKFEADYFTKHPPEIETWPEEYAGGLKNPRQLTPLQRLAVHYIKWMSTDDQDNEDNFVAEARDILPGLKGHQELKDLFEKWQSGDDDIEVEAEARDAFIRLAERELATHHPISGWAEQPRKNPPRLRMAAERLRGAVMKQPPKMYEIVDPFGNVVAKHHCTRSEAFAKASVLEMTTRVKYSVREAKQQAIS